MKKNTNIKAVGLLSGGLDSTLAVKLVIYITEIYRCFS